MSERFYPCVTRDGGKEIPSEHLGLWRWRLWQQEKERKEKADSACAALGREVNGG